MRLLSDLAVSETQRGLRRLPGTVAESLADSRPVAGRKATESPPVSLLCGCSRAPVPASAPVPLNLYAPWAATSPPCSNRPSSAPLCSRLSPRIWLPDGGAARAGPPCDGASIRGRGEEQHQWEVDPGSGKKTEMKSMQVGGPDGGDNPARHIAAVLPKKAKVAPVRHFSTPLRRRAG